MLSRPLTVMQGPPGTGKSQVVAGVTVNERLKGKSVLISAVNHKALDAVMERVQKLDGSGGRILFRCNSKAPEASDFGFRQAIEKLLKETPHATARDETEFREAKERLDQLLRSRKTAEENAAHIHALSQELEALEGEKLNLKKSFPWLDALSPLPSKKEMESLTESLELLEYHQGHMAAFALCHPWQALRLRSWTRRIHALSTIPQLPLAGRIRKAALDQIREATECVKRLAEKLDRAGKIQKDLLSEPKSATDWAEDMARDSEEIRRELPGYLALDGKVRLGAALGSGNQNRAPLDRAGERLRNVGTGLMRASTFANPDFRHELESLLVAYPAWAVSALSVGKFIPPVGGLFDLVLIDEATQANIAQAIPLLFRAKRAAVIGDPRQLQFISNLRPDKDVLLRKQAGVLSNAAWRFRYCERSLYDLAAGTSGATPVMLNETFRSCQEIAAYSSEVFYRGKLLVATDAGRLRTPRGHRQGIEWVDTKGKVKPRSGGSCWCDEEIKAVSREVKAILENAGFEGTLGVVTPFTPQADEIAACVNQEVSRKRLEEAQFHSATAHSFQGDERDVIVMSLCCSADMPKGCLNFVRSNPNIFNVATSRARSLLVIVGDRTWAASCGIPHIAGLTENRRTMHKPLETKWSPYESPYEEALGERLKKEGFNVIPQYRVGARRLDLALVDGTARLDIEVDSDAWHRGPDGRRKPQDAWRDEQLTRLGWKTLRIWTFRIDDSMDDCVKRVRETWEKLLGTARQSNH